MNIIKALGIGSSKQGVDRDLLIFNDIFFYTRKRWEIKFHERKISKIVEKNWQIAFQYSILTH